MNSTANTRGAVEAEGLRRIIRDLMALAALPALWVGLRPEAVLRSLVEAVHQILRGEWVYALLQEDSADRASPPMHIAWGNAGVLDGAVIAALLGEAIDQDGPRQIPSGPGRASLRVFVARLPLEAATARLAFASRRADFPTSDEQLLINVAVNQGAIALSAARLQAARDAALRALNDSHARLQEETRTVETLHRVGLTLAAELDVEAILHHLTEAARELTGAQFGAFVSEGGDARSDAPDRYSSYLDVPIVTGSGGVLGRLVFGHARAGVFGPREERLVSGIAAHAAIALDNARLYDVERQARAEAEEAVHARDEFLGIASHELRNPLAGLIASLQMMRRSQARGQLDSARLERFVAAMEQAAGRLSLLLEDLLDVSRLRAGQLHLHRQPTDMAELIRNQVEQQLQQAGERQIELRIGVDNQLFWVDPDRIEQVIANLLANAVKYSAESCGPVLVSLEDGEQGGLLLQVRDDGIGLPPGEAESIFAPFGRAANAHKRNIPGMGLGLYICRHIIQSHGGRIWAESPGEGLGTTVCVWLPRTEAESG
jgi:signal transduction histidine kinase